MLKFIIPIIFLLLIVFFWEKICELFYKKIKIKLNYWILWVVLLIIAIIILLLNS